MKNEHANLLGVVFDAVTLDQAVKRCVDFCRNSYSSNVVMTVNASHLCMMSRDVELARAGSVADMIVADGMPVVWAIRATGQSMPERVPGIDLMDRLLAAAVPNGLSVYFLGAHQQVVEKLVGLCRTRFPGLQVAGFRNGYFGPDEYEAIVEDIRASGAHILFIGMPSPFKEVWSERYRNQLQVPVILGVGGAFDVLAGYIKRAPPLFQSAGLEWFWRLMMEPRKLWWRYLTTNVEFIWRAFNEVVAHRAYASRQMDIVTSRGAMRAHDRRVGPERRATERRAMASRRSYAQAPVLADDRRSAAPRRNAARRSTMDRRGGAQRLAG